MCLFLHIYRFLIIDEQTDQLGAFTMKIIHFQPHRGQLMNLVTDSGITLSRNTQIIKRGLNWTHVDIDDWIIELLIRHFQSPQYLRLQLGQ